MSYFVWAPDLEIDQGPIDDDHRKLVDYVNQLHSATSAGYSQKVINEILGKLITYTREHFEREEREMERYKFPQVAQHKQQHRQLLEEVNELKKKLDGGSITVGPQVSTLLRDWLSIHIRRQDKELVRHIRAVKKGLA